MQGQVCERSVNNTVVGPVAISTEPVDGIKDSKCGDVVAVGKFIPVPFDLLDYRGIWGRRLSYGWTPVYPHSVLIISKCVYM